MSHPSTRRLARRALIIALAVCAHGARAADAGVIGGELPELMVEGRAETFHVPMYEDQVLFLYCAERPESIDTEGSLTHIYAAKEHVILLSRAQRKKAPLGTLTVKFGSYTAHIKVGGTPDFFLFEPAYRLTHITDRQVLEKHINEEVERRTVIMEQAHEDAFDTATERQFAEHLARNRQLFPVTEHTRTDQGADISLTLASATWTGKKLFLTLDLDNRSSQPFPADHVTVQDKTGQEYPAHTMAMFPAPAADTPRLVPPARDARLVVAIDDAMQGDFSATRVTFRDPTTSRTAWMAVDEWQHRNPFMVPKTPEQIARERREELRAQRDEEARGRVSIQVQPMFGAIWLENPLESGDLDATSVKGIGVRVGYGFNRYLAIEGELMGATSGEASFSGTWNGANGNATRDATLGRAQFGGVLRLGRQYIPTLRLGIGFQGSNHGTVFTPDNGSPMGGPDGGFEVDMMLSVGAGLDIRLSEHWMIGAIGTFSGGLRGQSQILGTGLHLSYSWKSGAGAEDTN